MTSMREIGQALSMREHGLSVHFLRRPKRASGGRRRQHIIRTPYGADLEILERGGGYPPPHVNAEGAEKLKNLLHRRCTQNENQSAK